MGSRQRGRPLTHAAPAANNERCLLPLIDFFAPAARLVVEVDGSHHTRQRGADTRRDRALAEAGLTVVRLPAQLVLSNLPAALQAVVQALRR